MNTVAVILARAGSRGLPDKCVLPLCGRAVLSYTISHAQQSGYVNEIVLTTDSTRAAAIGRVADVFVVDRPAHLASDTATTQDAARHAIEQFEAKTLRTADVIVILGGNVPLREDGLIDRCVDLLVQSGCDSVQTVMPVGKHHPDWMYRIDDDCMQAYRPNNIVRRQELEPLYGLSGAVVVVRRTLLMSASAGSEPGRYMSPETAGNPTAYLGQDRRAVVQEEESVDIDTPADFYRAEALIRVRNEVVFVDAPRAGSRRPAFTAAVSHAGGYERR